MAQLLLALVSSGDQEHSSTVHDTETNGTNSNTSSGGLLLSRLVTLATVTEDIAVATVAIIRVTIVGVVVGIRVTKDVDLGVDDGGQITDDLKIIVVQWGVRGKEISLETVDHVLGIMDLGESSDVSPLGLCVKRNNLANKNAVLGEATSISKTLGEVFEKLSSCDSVASQELVVEREQETQLDGNRAFRDRLVGVVRKDHTGNVSRKSGGG
jgi:hypothetical protein